MKDNRIFSSTPEFSNVGGVSCPLVKMLFTIFRNNDLFHEAKRYQLVHLVHF